MTPLGTTPSQPELFRFDDVDSTRDHIYSRTLAELQKLPPVSNTRYSLGLSNLHYVDPPTVPIAKRKHALLSGGTLQRRIQGTWNLTDAAGQPIASQTGTVARVPIMTQHGTYVINGSEWAMANQPRLQPGIYTRARENGELEAHVNVAKGLGHKLHLEPNSGIFRFEIAQSKLPLVSVLRAIGVTDEQLVNTWGKELTMRNIAKDDSRVVDKLYKRLFPRGEADNAAAKREAIGTAFQQMVLDPEVTQETLKMPFGNVSSDAILTATKKLLSISRGEADPDDRDALPFQKLMSAPDLFAERASRGGQVLRQLLWKASSKGSLDNLPHAPLDGLLQGTLLSTGLASPLEEINPGEVFDYLFRATRMGEGGIPSIDSIPDESRAVQPTQFGFIDFLRTPESSRVGVDMRLATAARRGADGKLYTQIRDIKTGDMRYVSAQEASKLVLAFPWEMKSKSNVVRALVGGKVRPVQKSEVDAEIPHMESAFSSLGNMVPMKSAVKGQRAVMAARMLTQALPLVGGEAPLVQGALPDNLLKSFEEEYGDRFGALRSDIAGRVTKITPDEVTIRDPETGKSKKYELYNRFPFNRKTQLHQSPLVKQGDLVKPGQLIARSNFTDEFGTTALGLNARVAYVPYKGYNFEDAIVVSQSFADRAKSQHTHQFNYAPSTGDFMGKNAYVSIFAGNTDRRQLEQMDKDGVVKPGTIVQKDDPLILAASPRPVNRKSLLRKNTPTYKDASIRWESDTPGEVIDVVRSRKGPTVVVASIERLQTGDKLSGRYGDKGVVGKIVPDSEMPHDADGQPFEVLLNPLGVQSRTNTAQVYEALLGKIAKLRGRPYKVQDFAAINDLHEFVEKELKHAGISQADDITDPETGRKIPQVLTGNRWIMKLHHTAGDKEQGRGIGEYTAEQTPSRSGDQASKRIGMLAVNAMLSHGATGALREAGLIRGQANPDYMIRYMAGYAPETPQVPYVYRKFVNNLKASGINVIRDGPRNHIMAMTNKDIDELAAGREIQNAETVDWKTMEPIKGGLFDRELTGGHPSNEGGGEKWSFISLPTPYPNPVMEDPIRKVLNLTKPEFLKILSGEEELEGLRGPQAIGAALEKISLPRAIQEARSDISSGKKTRRDSAVRRLGYLRAAERIGIHPKEWMLNKVPVLPPAFRPVSVMSGNKIPLVADPNYLYKELLESVKAHKDANSAFGDDIPDERLNVYNAFKAVVGLGDPSHPKNVERGVKGVLKSVFGSSPKFGSVQRQLLGSTVDFVGRAVIAPDPDLGMDEVAIPEDSAWSIYTPVLTRRLVRRGWKRTDAAREIETRSPAAREELRKEMEEGVVIISRAPELHRYGVMAARPKLTKAAVMKLPPFVVSGFGADYDGDQMNIHVPIGEAERRDALEKMLPSKNLLAISNFKAHQLPSHEFLGGLYTASTAKSDDKPVKTFQSASDAILAYRRGEISIDQKVQIVGAK